MNSKSERLAEVRRENILRHAAEHFDQESEYGRAVATEHAISSMIGAAVFLEAKHGKQKTKAIIAGLELTV